MQFRLSLTICELSSKKHDLLPIPPPLLVRLIFPWVTGDLLYKTWDFFFILDVHRHWCSNELWWDDNIILSENKSENLLSSTLYMITLSYGVFFVFEAMPRRHDNTGFWLNVLHERGTSSVRIYKFFFRTEAHIRYVKGWEYSRNTKPQTF